MAKHKNNKNKPQNLKQATPNNQPEFKSPSETWWGKTIIWLLIIGTVVLVVISVIFALINAF